MASCRRETWASLSTAFYRRQPLHGSGREGMNGRSCRSWNSVYRSPLLVFAFHITVLRSDQARESVITVPPLILIEILSKDDTLRSMRERVDDYLHFGVKHVWILDPGIKRAYVCTQTAFQGPDNEELIVPGTPIRLGLRELF